MRMEPALAQSNQSSSIVALGKTNNSTRSPAKNSQNKRLISMSRSDASPKSSESNEEEEEALTPIHFADSS